jgi:PAS domain S-box-containing protein
MILLGRTRLSENPLTQPIINNLLSLTDIQGAGILVDETGLILFHPDFGQVGTYFTEPIGQEVFFNPNAIAPDGTRLMIYIQPVVGRSWATITTVPAEVAQQIALENIVPLIGMLATMAAAGFLIIRLGLRLVTSNIQELVLVSGRIAKGDLDHKLEVISTDEVGQLGQSLEQMRLNLKSRMNEINQLLFVSQGVASTLEIEVAVNPILKGALASGASSARLVLAPAALPDYDQAIQTQFGLGASSDQFEYLDIQILALVERQPENLLINPRPALLGSTPGYPVPAALMAIALRHENVLYGTLWVAFDQPHVFTEEEKRFLTAIAGQAALAASNARLYLSAQLGGQRLEAILNSTPDPVLVTDHKDRLLLANPAAVVLLGDENEPFRGIALEEIIKQEELLTLLQDSNLSEEPKSVEVGFPDNRIYYATASPVLADGQVMGRVCVLSDITQFKELDALKSEFVANVSHDLRSPLTLMRGYATMLQMVGELNESQTGYINKIVTGVENMSLLVNNLLDLGRIEAGVGLQLEMVPMTDITRQVTETLHIQAIQKQIDLSLNLPEKSMPLVEADQALLHQAIYNLVDNAIKYTEVGGKVNVIVREEDEMAIFEVGDTGIGISPVDLPRLFERFYRAVGRKSRQQRGSGLGLTIVKSIAERHGGSIRVDSQLGKWSNFVLSIPLRQSAEPKK